MGGRLPRVPARFSRRATHALGGSAASTAAYYGD